MDVSQLFPQNSQVRVLQVLDYINENKKATITARVISNKLKIPKSTVYRILTEDLHLTKRLGRFLPHELSHDQKEHRVLVCQTNLGDYKKNTRKLPRTLALDETSIWVGLYMKPGRDQMKYWLKENEIGPTSPLQSNQGNKRILLMAM